MPRFLGPRGFHEDMRQRSALWTPRDAGGGLRSWLDCGDQAAMRFTGTGASAPRDKARAGTWGNGGGSAPAFAASTSMGRRPGITITTSNTLVSSAVSLTLPLVAVCIARVDSGTGQWGRILAWHTSGSRDYDSTTGLSALARFNSGSNVFAEFNGSVTGQAPFTPGDVHIFAIEVSTFEMRIFINGASAATGSGVTGQNWSAVRVSIGTADGTSASPRAENMAGQYGEAMVYCGADFRDVRQRAEGAMAWRWGLERLLLPRTHRYAQQPPLR